MLDAALIKECADPSLKLAIVEQFVTAVGSPDPLARRGDGEREAICVLVDRIEETFAALGRQD